MSEVNYSAQFKMIKNTLVFLTLVVVASATLVSYHQFIRPTSSQESQSHSAQEIVYPAQSKQPQSVQRSPINLITNPSPASSNEASNWKIYTSETYRYQFEYPSSGELTTSVAGLDEHNSPQLQETRVEFVQQFDPLVGDGQDEFGFAVTVYDNPTRASSRQWALQQWSDDVIRKQRAVNINGRSGYELIVFETDQMSNYIYLSKNKNIYKLSYWNPDSMLEFTPEVRQNYAEIFQRMERSFKALQ